MTVLNNKYTIRSSRIKRSSISFQLFVLVGWIIFTIALLNFGKWEELSRFNAAIYSLIIVVSSLLTVGRLSPNKAWAPASTFLVVLALFHLGLTPFWVLGLEPYTDYQSMAWFNSGLVAPALYLASVAVCSYTIGVLIALTRSRNLQPKKSSTISLSEIGISRYYANVGALIVIFAVVAWFAQVGQAGGLEIITSGYLSFLSKTEDSTIGYVYFLVALGLGLMFIEPLENRLRKTALGFFILYTLATLAVGLRGSALYPVVIALTVIAFRRKMPNMFWVLIGTLTLLMSLSLIRSFRDFGLSNASIDLTVANPANAIAELGGSLFIVVTSIYWHQNLGLSFRGGDTYSGTLVRFFESFLLGDKRLPAGADFRLMNSEVLAKVGPRGGSIVAEAFHNFNTVGVVVVLLLVGLVFGTFSILPIGVHKKAAFVVVAGPLFNHIRNSFAPVIPELIIGGIIILGILFYYQLTHPQKSTKINR